MKMSMNMTMNMKVSPSMPGYYNPRKLNINLVMLPNMGFPTVFYDPRIAYGHGPYLCPPGMYPLQPYSFTQSNPPQNINTDNVKKKSNENKWFQLEYS